MDQGEDQGEDRDPGLVVRDGVPVSTRFDDVYFSGDGGLAESAHVFLAGAGLPDAWTGRRCFTIAETGFGTGLNFLATRELWRRRRPAGGVLHYLAVEGYPIRRGSLPGVLAPFRAVADLAAQLIARYPRPVEGLHRLWFPEDGVCLTLAIGEAATVLPGLDAVVDAWFLDGFAPARNPSMWGPAVLDQVARLVAPGCRLATSTDAGAVRCGLEERGFAMQRRSGSYGKRACLLGVFRGAPVARPRPGRVAVVGAGIAGASLVGALARRGIETVWIERRPGLAAEASGNPLGVLMPRPILGDGAAGSLSAAAFRHVLAECAGRGVRVGGDGVLELASDPAVAARQRRLFEAGVLEAVDGTVVDAPKASRIAGVALDRPGIWYRRAGWVSPPAMVAALAGGVAPWLDCPVGFLERVGEAWRLSGPDGAGIAEADVVIVAGGSGSTGLAQYSGLPLRPVRGQLSELPETMASGRLRTVLTFGGYLTPAVAGRHVAGATYERDGFDPAEWPQPVTADGHERAVGGLPEQVRRWFDGVVPVGGRAAIRATTPDRMPIAGALADEDGTSRAGLFVLAGLGSRGLVTAPLLAELVVSDLLGEPRPVERGLADVVRPGRFQERLRRAPARSAGRRSAAPGP